MVCKEELCKWFKNLMPHQRIDYMCGLLHMCLPLELRFLGSVLEDHGKKNYNYLRDAELKANNSVEISKLYTGTDKQIRATVSIYLSLLHSSNTPCAQLLYEVLEKNLERVFALGTDPNDKEEILMALTLAINHPAFQFHQKSLLYDHYDRFNAEANDRRNKSNELNLSEEPPLLVSPTIDPSECQHSQDCIVNIEMREPVRKQSGKRLDLRITWSNGEVYELSKTNKEMHDFHLKVKALFPGEIELQKREWKSTFQSNHHQHSHSHKEDHIKSVSNYISLLLRLPSLLKHEEVSQFFKGDNLVQPSPPEPVASPTQRIPCMPMSPVSVNTGEEQGIPPFPLKSLPVCNPQLHQYPHNFMVADHNLRRCNPDALLPSKSQRNVYLPTCVPPPADSPSHSHSPPSSATESPLNSRSTSPSSHNPDAECKETVQLLHLLNLEQFTDKLGKLSLKQLRSEDLTKAGLPVEAQHILRSKLENINPNREKPLPVVNGLVDGSSSGGTLSPASPNSLPWSPAPPPQPYFLPVSYQVIQSPPIPQHNIPQEEESEVSSAPTSPTQQMFIEKPKTDSSGSDDNEKDKTMCDHDRPKGEGRRRVGQNRTLLQRAPQYPHVEEMKVGLLRQPSPHMSTEVSPQVPPHLFNGYQSDPNPGSVTSANYPRPAFPIYRHQTLKPAPAPAHTNIGLHNKNIINMPQDGHLKQPVMMYYQSMARTDIPMTTSVMPINLNNNTATNQTYSANNEGVHNAQRGPPYRIVLPPTRSVPTNLNNAAAVAAVTVTQGGGGQPMHGGHSPVPPANISVKPNGVPPPIPNPAGTPPEAVMAGSDSPLPHMVHSQSTGSTTVTFSTATSSYAGNAQPVSSANHTQQCSSCGCNCSNSGTPTSASYQQPYIPAFHPILMQPGIPFSNLIGHQMPPPNYPNGISHEIFNHPGFQHMHHVPHPMAQHVHSMYGNLHHSHGNPGAHAKHKHQGCYNCGSSQHKAQDCKETSMDGISGNYHLNYKPKSDSD